MWSHSRALCWKQVYVVIEFVLQSRSQPDWVRHKLYLQSLVRLRHHHNTKRGSMVFIPADHLQNLGQYVLKQVEAVRAAPCWDTDPSFNLLCKRSSYQAGERTFTLLTLLFLWRGSSKRSMLPSELFKLRVLLCRGSWEMVFVRSLLKCNFWKNPQY